MPNLWNVARLEPVEGVVVPGGTLPAVFWNAVALRADRIWLRDKKLGIWHSWSWRRTGEAVPASPCEAGRPGDWVIGASDGIGGVLPRPDWIEPHTRPVHRTAPPRPRLWPRPLDQPPLRGDEPAAHLIAWLQRLHRVAVALELRAVGRLVLRSPVQLVVQHPP